MKKEIYLIAALILLGGGCKKKSGEAGKIAPPSPEVMVARPEQKDITYTYQYPAYLNAQQTVNLVARVGGYLEQMNYTPGSRVKKNALLFVIEPQPYIDQVEAAKATVAQTQAQLSYAQAQYEKMKEALPQKAVSEIDYIQAESGYQSAVAALENAKAQLNKAQIQLGYCYIKAPFDGRVSRNEVDVQNYVNGSLQPVTLATLYQDRKMYAYFNMAYPEFEKLPSATAGKLPISISNSNDTNKVWNGDLDYSAPGIDLQTGTVTVRAIVDNPNEELLSGMYVKITIPYKEVPKALLIPESSIGTNQAGRYVYLVDKQNQVVIQTVKVGILTPDGMREIISGLTPDDRYVVEAMMSLRPGMFVRPSMKQ